MERITTGIKGLDELIEGGFKPKSVNLITGDPGAGKTIFAIQFLFEGLKKGEACLYVTFEERKKKLYEDMLQFGIDLDKFEKAGLFVFLEYTPEQVKKLLIEGGGTIDTIINKSKIKRLVIDSITSFALLYQDKLLQKEAALELFALIEEWGCTALVTSQNTEMEESTVNAALEFEVDSILILYHIKFKGERKRALEILKMRGTKHPNKTFAVEIESDGMKINSKEIITF